MVIILKKKKQRWLDDILTWRWMFSPTSSLVQIYIFSLWDLLSPPSQYLNAIFENITVFNLFLFIFIFLFFNNLTGKFLAYVHFYYLVICKKKNQKQKQFQWDFLNMMTSGIMIDY